MLTRPVLSRPNTLARCPVGPCRTIQRIPARQGLLKTSLGCAQVRRVLNEASEVKIPFTDISAYHEAADDSLHHISDRIEEISEELDIPGFDLKESGGVLEINLGTNGSYVLNKQTPNQQIWFSSPISGPKRYNYDPEGKIWVNTRDGHALYEILSDELSKILKREFRL